jgi:hypothetical protein
LIFGTSPAGVGGETNIAERMRIDENGNVGIGETTPTARLHLVGGSTSGDYMMKIYSGTDLVAWARKK